MVVIRQRLSALMMNDFKVINLCRNLLIRGENRKLVVGHIICLLFEIYTFKANADY